ncbi:Ribosomal protein L25/L23 [Chloroherpeton thalassium ATCC 35110]|uniref:Large ribosomal subunit protein uL23 n=1 Tax=Chloroherpeton thalassium (strain ATCC 35110 / GB-78) TaxID=517418 RepID=RL23_CHLT3|nr:50S ribosomal protein L23 [Chloroherpeton thalassium]B3QY26.1 RecName: Full=Large ribosomal subunit protein uL23; AltName: Full=50S ribosomal protein L23 [Chloroherpeton thalassium ATCC 35110]ACF13554.1 Ribosomal protein L25/L23 [Chloroherpeton thalassium ATCC 35110]
MRNALIYPILTEKATRMTEVQTQYTFKVNPRANKLEIRKAVEEKFNVDVDSVRTVICRGKRKRQFTRKGLIEGKKSNWKKAIVTLKDGATIDFYGATASAGQANG